MKSVHRIITHLFISQFDRTFYFRILVVEGEEENAVHCIIYGNDCSLSCLYELQFLRGNEEIFKFNSCGPLFSFFFSLLKGIRFVKAN